MPVLAYVILAVAWLVWVAPFFLRKRNRSQAAKLDRRARFGIILEAFAYALLWQNSFWLRPLAAWQLGVSLAFLTAAGVLSWNSVRVLGRQWRLDAGLNADHELVRSGAYRIVRHPIYTSMLCLLLGTGLLVTPPLLLLAATAIFIIGTEIRVRIEDALLASRFGDEFTAYRRSVGAYIPFVK